MTTIKELINLNGRRALITGAAGGLGKMMAETLAELGADLILVDKSITNILAIKESILEKWSVKIQNWECDLEHSGQRRELIENIRTENKELHILINNAAFVGASSLEGWAVPFEDQTLDTWRRALEVNLTAVFDLCQGFQPIMKATNNGSIINIGSIYGQYGPDWSLYKGTSMSNAAGYSASKGGLLQFTRWLATTVSPQVRVNAISPGGILRNQAESFVSMYSNKTPLQRMAVENDFKGVIAYLASDMSAYVTGQNISVDGGWGVW
jgi:NAD(P)-dependent dehydrogenase (short-subunit alcohol dehydrogenase family)